MAVDAQTIRLFSSTSILFPITTYDNLVSSTDSLKQHLIWTWSSQMETSLHLVVKLVLKIRLSMNPMCRMTWHYWHRIPVHSSRHLCRRQLPNSEIVPDQLYPRSTCLNMSASDLGTVYGTTKKNKQRKVDILLTCIVTSLSSTRTSLVKKSAPIVAL